MPSVPPRCFCDILHYMNKAAVTAAIFSAVVLGAQQKNEAPQVFTAAQAAAGKAAYESTCISCHTSSLNGRTGAPGELPPLESLSPVMQQVVANANGQVPPLAGEAFMAKWGGKTTQELSRRVNEAVGGFRPRNATDATYLELTAYFLEANGARPGREPLTSATAVGIDYETH